MSRNKHRSKSDAVKKWRKIKEQLKQAEEKYKKYNVAWNAASANVARFRDTYGTLAEEIAGDWLQLMDEHEEERMVVEDLRLQREEERKWLAIEEDRRALELMDEIREAEEEEMEAKRRKKHLRSQQLFAEARARSFL